MDKYQPPKRSKGRHISEILTQDLYKEYLAGINPVESITGKGKTLGSYKIKPKKYGDVLKDLNESIIRLIVLENFEYRLPFSLGKISMVQKKVKFKLDSDGNLNTKNLSVDFKATKELWSNDIAARESKQLIFHTNEHTNGCRMAFWWSKKGVKCQGLDVYYFTPCRAMKRSPAKFLKDSDYKLMFFETPTKKFEKRYM